jgi:hypothetical protein
MDLTCFMLIDLDRSDARIQEPEKQVGIAEDSTRVR